MLSKSQISFIHALQQKKFRKVHGAFVVEGLKSVQEFIDSDYEVLQIFSVDGAHAKMDKIPHSIKLFEVTDREMSKISNLKTPQGLLAVVRIPKQERLDPVLFAGKFSLVLDDIQDPGNLGTIIRTADWFGFDRLVCSVGTVDAFNPKVVQATMGSLSRVKIDYVNLSDFFEEVKLPVFGALLEGHSIYEQDFGKEGLIFLGNEGNGISEELKRAVSFPVTIPRVGAAESLNVAVSAALFCAEVIRKE